MQSALERLQDAVGMDVYNQVLKVLAGETVYFPANGTRNDKRQRNKEIRYDFNYGFDMDALSKKYSLSESQIRKILYSTYC